MFLKDKALEQYEPIIKAIAGPLVLVGAATAGIYFLFRKVEPYVTGAFHVLTDTVDDVTEQAKQAATEASRAATKLKNDTFEKSESISFLPQKKYCAETGKTFPSLAKWYQKNPGKALMGAFAGKQLYHKELKEFETECLELRKIRLESASKTIKRQPYLGETIK